MEQLATGRLSSSASLPGDTGDLPSPYSLLLQSDLDLVHYLRLRDGDLPARVPSHAPRGRCKYARVYPNGNCPWCSKRPHSAS